MVKTPERTAQAGTLESGDILVIISPGQAGSGIKLELESIVILQYGHAIENTINHVLKTAGVTDVCVKASDRGALEFTIRARLLTALGRSGVMLGGENYAN